MTEKPWARSTSVRVHTEDELRAINERYERVIRENTCADCGTLKPLPGYGVHRCPRRWHARLERFGAWLERFFPDPRADERKALEELGAEKERASRVAGDPSNVAG